MVGGAAGWHEVTTSMEAIAAWQADIASVTSLVAERSVFLNAQAALAGGAGVIAFVVAGSDPASGQVRVPIAQPLDEAALALVNGAIEARLAEIATALAALGVTE